MRSWFPAAIAALVASPLLVGCGGKIALSDPSEDRADIVVRWKTGKGPTLVVSGDLTCDGRADLVTLDAVSRSVTVTVTPRDTFGNSIPAVAHSIVWDTAQDLGTADLDHDGLLDLFVAGNNENWPFGGVSVHLADRDRPGGFFPPTIHFTGKNADRVASGDLTGDGLADLAVMDESDGTVSLLLQDPVAPGSFNLLVFPPLGQRCAGLSIADLDRDGSLDLLTLCPGTTRCVCWRFPAGPRQTTDMTGFRTISPRCQCACIADVTGDGWPDIVYEGDGSRCIVMRNGRHPFRPSFFDIEADLGLVGGGWGVAAGDLDGDGLLDLAVDYIDPDSDDDWVECKQFLPSNFTIRHHGGSGGGAGKVTWGIAVADLDGDSKPDVATVDADGDSLTAYFRAGNYPPKGDPDFDTLRSVPLPDSPAGPGDLALADLDRDGRLDVCVCQPALGGVQVLFQDAASATGFSPGPLLPTGPGCARIAILDVSNDGIDDVIVGVPGTLAIAIHLRDPSSDRSFLAPLFLPCDPIPAEVAAGDVDGDGRVDVCVALDAVPGEVLVYFGVPGGPGRLPFQLPSTRLATGADNTRGLALADLDCDGDLDIACSNGDDTCSVLRGLVTPVAPGPSPSVHRFTGGVRVASGDVNGDGRLDLVTGAEGSLRVLENIGSQGSDGARFAGSFGLDIGPNLFTGDPDFDLVDLNRDGPLDVITITNEGRDRLRMFLGDETEATGRKTVVFPHVLEVSGRCLATGDLNLDGLLDVVVAGPSLSGVGGSLNIFFQR